MFFVVLSSFLVFVLIAPLHPQIPLLLPGTIGSIPRGQISFFEVEQISSSSSSQGLAVIHAPMYKRLTWQILPERRLRQMLDRFSYTRVCRIISPLWFLSCYFFHLLISFVSSFSVLLHARCSCT